MTLQAIDTLGRTGRHLAPGLLLEVVRPVAREEAFAEPLSQDSVFSFATGGSKAANAIAVREELGRVLQSPTLIQSRRLSRFLCFAVEATLDGNGGSLKEYTIGIEAYGRRSDFDPSQDSIVRTEARRLRAKLQKYYEEEGASDPVCIEFRPGSYVPTFHMRKRREQRSADRRRIAQIPELAGLTISVLPFAYLPGDSFGESCARGLTDEFMHRLTRTEGLRVFGPAAISGLSSPAANSDRCCEPWATSEGIVRTEGNRIRVTSRLYDADGYHAGSWRFDAEATPDRLFAALERIASEIVTSIELLKASSMDA